MVKSDVDFRVDNHEDIQNIIFHYLGPGVILDEFHVLRGGYSGTNYLITTKDNQKGVLKIALGYSSNEAEEQALITAYISNNSTINCCGALKLYNSDPIKYITLTNDSQPVMFLSYVDGISANHLIEKELFKPDLILYNVAFNLSQLHSIPINNCNLRTILQGGGVFTSLHVSGNIKQVLELSEYSNHPFVTFYLARYLDLIHDLTLKDLPIGILHGDPFLDNIHFIEETGQFSGFVDFEDSCIGPMLFDLSCCIVGNCFTTTGELDLCLLEALLIGYNNGRNLVNKEYDLLYNFLKHSLLLNCSWRFINFNITHPDQRLQHGDSYKELLVRLQHIEDSSIKIKIYNIIEKIENKI